MVEVRISWRSRWSISAQKQVEMWKKTLFKIVTKLSENHDFTMYKNGVRKKKVLNGEQW